MAAYLGPLLAEAFAFMGSFAGAAAGAVAGAAGSVASQTVGVVTGIQKKFDWGAVGIAAIAGGSSGGLAPAGETGMLGLQAGSFAEGFLRGVVTNVVTQGVSMAVGLQKRFDWAAVASAGVVSGVSSWVGGGILAEHPGADMTGVGLVSGMAGAIAGAGAKTAINGRDFGDNLMSLLPDAIGATIGNAIGEQISDAFRPSPEDLLAGYQGLTRPEIRQRLIDEQAALASDPEAYKAYVSESLAQNAAYDAQAEAVEAMRDHPELLHDPDALRNVYVAPDASYNDDDKYVMVTGSDTIGTATINMLANLQRGVNYADEKTWGFASAALHFAHGGPLGMLIDWAVNRGTVDAVASCDPASPQRLRPGDASTTCAPCAGRRLRHRSPSSASARSQPVR